MKFIVSSLSPSMFLHKDYALECHEINEEEFQAYAYDAYSCLGAKDIANVTGFAYNKEVVKCRIGDVLLLAQLSKGVLRFWCIQVVEPKSALVREDELYAEIGEY